jgi:biopolymer transport protein TolQ
LDAAEIDLLNIIWHSGIVVKAVLLSLVAASIFSWGIIFKKRRAISIARKNNKEFLQIYHAGANMGEVMKTSEALPFSPYKILFQNGYQELAKLQVEAKDKTKMRSHFKDFGMGSIERALGSGVNQTNIQLENFLPTLASIGSISPFIGLFGTVWGIIDSFTGIAGGGATLDAVAPGIAEALVATAIGLLAAIPAVWFYNSYSSQNSNMNAEMESFGQDFLNHVERTLV